MLFAATNTTPVVFWPILEKDGVFSVRLTRDVLAATTRPASSADYPDRSGCCCLPGKPVSGRRWRRPDPPVQLSVAKEYSEGPERFDLVVLDDGVPATWPAANVLAFHVADTNWFLRARSVARSPAIVDWRNTHPVLRFVNFDNVLVAQAMAKAPVGQFPGGFPGIAAGRGGELGRQRIVGWPSTRCSTWHAAHQFPIFVANAVDWLNPDPAAAARLSVKAGSLPAATSAKRPNQRPRPRGVIAGGAERSIPLEAHANSPLGIPAHQGLYRVLMGTNEELRGQPARTRRKPPSLRSDQLSVGRRGCGGDGTEARQSGILALVRFRHSPS